MLIAVINYLLLIVVQWWAPDKVNLQQLPLPKSSRAKISENLALLNDYFEGLVYLFLFLEYRHCKRLHV